MKQHNAVKFAALRARIELANAKRANQGDVFKPAVMLTDSIEHAHNKIPAGDPKSMGIGSLGGTGLGMLLGGGLGAVSPKEDEESRVAKMIRMALMGGGLGSLAGAGLGALPHTSTSTTKTRHAAPNPVTASQSFGGAKATVGQ